MPDEFDAFGRKQDDAGHSDLGWGTTEAPNEAPKEFQTVAPVTPVRRRVGPGARIVSVRWLISLIVLGGVGLTVFSVGKGAKETFDSARDLIPSSPSTVVDEGDGTVPRQVRAASFFTPKGLRAGLRILAEEQPGKITNFSFRKDRINVQVNRGGKSHNVQLSAGAEAPEEFTVTTATSRGTDTLIYEEISPAAVGRLMHAANARLNASVRQVDYFVVSKTLGPVQWGIYYKNGKIALGDSRGRFTRRIS